ncbi:MAG: hypothetical protein C0624_04250 [Desulfuromonas sp.]|nr:MAG: hypothetical protein C0624_04250 [Desulfuromonas sp.]
MILRQLKILEHALSCLRRRWGKSLAIILVFAFTVAVLASVLFLTHALRSEATRLLEDAPDLVVQRLSAGRHDLIPEHYREQIEAMPGVKTVQARAWGYYYDNLTKANFTMMGVDATAPLAWPLLVGEMPQADDECAVGSGVARVRGLGVDDYLMMIDAGGLGVSYRVTGVFQPESDLLANDLVLMSTAETRRFFALPEGFATDLAVTVYNPREIDTLARKIKRDFPDSRPITHGEIRRTYDAVFNWRGGMLLIVFAAALVAFCVLAWDKATGLSAEERREIGILKAIGWDTSDVLLLKFWEGVAIAVSGLLLGILAALAHVFLLGAPVLVAVIRGWSILFPPFELVPYIDLYQIFVLGFMTVVPYVASTVIPTWRAASAEPDSVMRM